MMDINNYNRGTIALQKGNLEKALQFYKREKNSFKELHLNLANTYRLLGHREKAWDQYILANSLDVLDLDGVGGEYPDALGNMGLLAYEYGDDLLASSLYVRALSINPLHYMSIWNNSLALLRKYCSGGALHQHAWRMHTYRFKAVKAISSVPVTWTGEKVSKLVVLAEQGIGDRLMYGRYLSLIDCPEIWVQCDASMDCFFSGYKICRTVEESGCTVGVPIGNLASIFGIVDGVWIPRAKTWNPKMTVCVEWAGSSTHKNDANRSCYAGYFSMLAKKFPSVRFINVRPDSKSVRGIEKLGGTWAESTSIVGGCDLVISVDTSIVHLAGSMGVDCLMLQPLRDTDFRWGNPITKVENGMGVEDNIWYSSVKVLENPGWDKLFTEVEKRLREKESAWFKLNMLGGRTPEEFIKEVECLRS